MIQLNNINKIYNNGHCALKHINFHLKNGEMAFLTGHSGAGKTTLLKLILMIEQATRGQIFLNKKDITLASKRQIPGLRRQIGMVFQNPRLLNQRTIFDNIALPLVVAGYRYQEIKPRVHAALDKVKLLHKAKSFPLELSAGEQQRIGIARAVVNKPPLLLADEPTGNLDPALSNEIMQLFEDFNAVGVSVLIATHDIELISSLNHPILTLNAGEFVDHEKN